MGVILMLPLSFLWFYAYAYKFMHYNETFLF